ncbi:MAG: hypothetical protein QOH79_1565 [Acidimicrobiaceae bacterium]
MSTYVYIDGLNFYYGAVKRTPHKWVDFERLVRRLLPQDQIGLIRYFTANVKPRFPGDRSHERQAAYLRAIDANPLVEITRGYFRSDVKWRALAHPKHSSRDLFKPELLPDFALRWMLGDAVRRRTDPATVARVVVPEEKGSDVNLATYLMYDALVNASCTKAVVITNDSDLVEPIKLSAAKIPVGIVNPHQGPTSSLLRAVASFEIPYRRKMAAQCQLPDPVIGKNGKAIHKPKEW